jgi:DNA repair protein RecN (Recombination protein N)
VDGDAVAFDDRDRHRRVHVPAQRGSRRGRWPGSHRGELSRVALAVKQVLAEVDDTPTLVFDEIDTGIGGRSADPVARSLWRWPATTGPVRDPPAADRRICGRHYRIAKRERDGRTVTDVERLKRDEREDELAR